MPHQPLLQCGAPGVIAGFFTAVEGRKTLLFGYGSTASEVLEKHYTYMAR